MPTLRVMYTESQLIYMHLSRVVLHRQHSERDAWIVTDGFDRKCCNSLLYGNDWVETVLHKSKSSGCAGQWSHGQVPRTSLWWKKCLVKLPVLLIIQRSLMGSCCFVFILYSCMLINAYHPHASHHIKGKSHGAEKHGTRTKLKGKKGKCGSFDSHSYTNTII